MSEMVERVALSIRMIEIFGPNAWDDTHGQVPGRIRMCWTELKENDEYDKYEYVVRGKETYRVSARAAIAIAIAVPAEKERK